MRTKLTTILSLIVLLSSTSCREFYDLLNDFKPDEPKVIDYASGFLAPYGLELDSEGNIWVAEAGTGNSDSRISVITAFNEVYPVIEGLTSVFPPDEPTALGASHLILAGHTLWFLNIAEGRLYQADLSSFQPGDAPLQASDLMYEEISSFVLDYDFGDADTGESNPYNLTLGPDGNIYITDAAANAIIRREAGSGELSVFAIFPNIPNPTEIGPPMIHSVPTGIVYDGQNFLVSTLTGFPFLEKEALIYQVNMNGEVSVYQEGFTCLVDIDLCADYKPAVVQYASFEQGFTPNTGRILVADEVILDEINYPLGIIRKGVKTYFVTNSVDGIVQRVKLD